jgi:glutaconate CoA-transferase subunit B
MTPTSEEVMIVAGSRLLLDDRAVFAGVGAPLIASVLAQRLHAPHLMIILEGGFVGPRMVPGKLPISTNEMRAAHGAVMHTGISDVFLYGQRGFFDYGFIGAAQIDRFGNVNTSIIGEADRPTVRLTGGGGANDIASSCREVFVMTRHEPRRFVERVDFVTSPGFLDGAGARERAGLLLGRPSRVVTDLAVMGFHPETKRMTLSALQPGVDMDDVVRNTGFELEIPTSVTQLEPASELELETLRVLTTGEAPSRRDGTVTPSATRDGSRPDPSEGAPAGEDAPAGERR